MKNILILEKDNVESIKLYVGKTKTFYKIKLTRELEFSGSKVAATTRSLLRMPEKVIGYIQNLDLLLELRDEIEKRIRELSLSDP